MSCGAIIFAETNSSKLISGNDEEMRGACEFPERHAEEKGSNSLFKDDIPFPRWYLEDRE